MLNPIFVSLPVTAMSGLVPVAEFVIVISLTADAVAVNFNYSFPLASLICAITGVVIVGEVKLPVALVNAGEVKILFVNVSTPVKVAKPAELIAAVCQAEPE